MIGLLQSARAKGEEAVRRAGWAFAAAGLLVIGAGFAAAAVVEALKLVAPAWAAFAAGAVFLLIAAAACLSRSQAPKENATAEGGLNLAEGETAPPLSAANGDWRRLLEDALVRESRDKPARAAAIAAIAGLILGAIEGLDERGS